MARQMANQLGMAPQDMAALMKARSNAPPPMYPSVQRPLIPVDCTDELRYMAEFKAELKERFTSSPFFLPPEAKSVDVRRYMDKYQQTTTAKFEPDEKRCPDELLEKKKAKKKGGPARKRRKLNESEVAEIAEKLTKLQDTEKSDEEVEDEDKEDSDDEEKEGGDAAAVSEDDMEEDNDYVHGYFDNGEGYNDGSDDGLGDEDY